MTEKSSDSEKGYLDGVKPGAASQDGNPADSSAADQGADNPASPGRDEDASPKSMLEAVQKAVEPAEAKEGESSTPKEVQAEEAGAETKPDDKPGADDEAGKDDQVPFHKHPRWVEVNKELKELRPLKQKAEAFDQLHQAMQTAGVTPDEADQAIELWRLMKTNPGEALKALKPYVTELESYTGEALPDDLKGAVDKGEISEELAKKVAKDRGDLRQTRAITERTTQDAARRQALAAKSAADRLWTDWQSTDPDFGALKDAVFKGVKLRVLEAQTQRKAMTPELARSMFNEALTEAREERRKLLPKRPEVNPKTPANSEATPGVAKPSTLLDAMKQGAAGTYVPA